MAIDLESQERQAAMSTQDLLNRTRNTLDRFEARIWADGRDLEELTDRDWRKELALQLPLEGGWP